MRLGTIALAVVGQALACGGLQPASAQRHVNTFDLTFPDGRGEIEWVSGSTFRFHRAWGGPLPSRPATTTELLPVTAAETAAGLRFEARYITIEIDTPGRVVNIATGAGEPLTQWRLQPGQLEAPIAPADHFYGLEASGAATLDVRGLAVHTRRPFLLSSAGFGEYYPQSGEYGFDLGVRDSGKRRVALPGETIEVVFYFGPTPASLFEEHLALEGPIEPFGAEKFKVIERAAGGGGTWETLRARLRALLAASLSARLVPEFDLAPFAGADPRLFSRAAQLASVMPVVYAPKGARGFERLRNRLRPYLLSYTKDARDRGGPVLHPLAYQDRQDPEAGRADEFMLGDELLVAPALDPTEDRDVYLPRGLWTALATGQRFKGRQHIRVRLGEDGPPLFARNGSIVPLAPEKPGAPLELHYFPSLGAEFFLFEEGLNEISQLHAGPAGDALRLEIESLVAREYEWVVHLPAGGEIRRRVKARAGGDQIVNLDLEGLGLPPA